MEVKYIPGLIFNNVIQILVDHYDYSYGFFTYEGVISSSDENWHRYHDYISGENIKIARLEVIENDGTKRVLSGNGIIGLHNFDFDKQGNVRFSGRIEI